MKKLLYLLAAFLFTNVIGYSQVRITVDSVNLYRVVDSLPHDYVSENWEEGPNVEIFASFKNETDETIKLKAVIVDVIGDINSLCFKEVRNLHGGIDVIFNYKGKMYEYGLSCVEIHGPKEVKPFEEKVLEIDCKIFFGSELLKQGYYDYRNMIIEILPTLQVVFEHNKKVYKSRGISRVVYIPNPVLGY